MKSAAPGMGIGFRVRIWEQRLRSPLVTAPTNGGKLSRPDGFQFCRAVRDVGYRLGRG